LKPLHRRYRSRNRRYSRRSGVVLAVVRSLAFLLLVVACVTALRFASDGVQRVGDQWGRPQIEDQGPSLSVLAGPQSATIQPRNRRLVYPYSVIPGGVSSAEELHEAAAHDTTVAEHYAGFDYKRARVIQVDRPRLVYLSYRRGTQIYWTSKQASLRAGEKLITDGKITARTRCGNQVSVLPQVRTAPEEPLMAELDRPDAMASGVEFPSSFDSDLLNVDPLLPIGPGSTAGGSLIGPGPPGVSMPFPVGHPINGGGCVPTQKNNFCKTVPPPPPPPTVPEPGTVVLVFSGAAAVFARFRHMRH
jgi:hypothetical protein